MNKLIIMLASAGLLYSCAPPSSPSGAGPAGRLEITPYKETEVILKDTLQVRTAYARTDSGRVSMYEFAQDYSNPQAYLDARQFAVFEKAVWMMVKDPKAKVYHYEDNPPLKVRELREMFRKCDSIDQISYDAKGNEQRMLVFACDSTSLVEQINKIVFFESWYFNPANNMIEWDVLGYSVWAYMMDKEAWREVFVVYRDEESLNKARKYR